MLASPPLTTALLPSIVETLCFLLEGAAYTLLAASRRFLFARRVSMYDRGCNFHN